MMKSTIETRSKSSESPPPSVRRDDTGTTASCGMKVGCEGVSIRIESFTAELPEREPRRNDESGADVAQDRSEEGRRFRSRERVGDLDLGVQRALRFDREAGQRRAAAGQNDARYVLVVSLPVAQ